VTSKVGESGSRIVCLLDFLGACSNLEGTLISSRKSMGALGVGIRSSCVSVFIGSKSGDCRPTLNSIERTVRGVLSPAMSSLSDFGEDGGSASEVSSD
jgi:hypothetical protein